LKFAGVFLSSSEPTFPIKEDIDKFCNFLVNSNAGIVYGGGNRGLMGYISKKHKEVGGIVKGVNLKLFHDQGFTAQDYIDHFEVEDTLYIRKKKLIDYSDFIVVLPGGVGTADEFFDVLTHLHMSEIGGGVLNKKLYLYNKDNYWSDLIAWIQKSVDFGMLSQIPKELIVVNTIDELISEIKENEI